MRHKSEFQVRYKTLSRKMAADMVRFSTSNEQPILFDIMNYEYIGMISI